MLTRETASACANCGGASPVPIYRQSGVPVQDVILIRDRDAAQAFPTGEIELGFCPDCGFAGNVAFEPARVRYSGDCEETQSCSETFGAFQAALVERLVERVDLRGGRVVEIGCGKGDFLARLCSRGRCRGTGYDPAYVAGRVDLPEGAEVHPVRFERGERLGRVDLLCCIMTLEHIASPRAFLAAVRAAIDEAGVPVYFQVPNARRIYRDVAFWDIYYEHCSYFSSSALTVLFETSGFSVDVVEPVYDDQYLSLFARTANNAARTAMAPVAADLLDDARGFARAASQSVARWRRVVDDAGEGGVVLWGGGSKAVAFLTALGPASSLRAVVDINPHKHGTWLPGSGYEVVAPERLACIKPALVIVMNRVYVAEIEATLARMGVAARVVALP